MALLWHERSRKFQQSQGKLPTLCTDGQVFVNINGDFWKEREKAVEQLDGLHYDRKQKWERPVVREHRRDAIRSRLAKVWNKIVPTLATKFKEKK
jgi:hypothetical protein